MDRDLAGKASREVEALHEFFVAWFRGEPANFALCEAVFAPDFRMVAPDGAVHERAAVMVRLRAARASAPADFAIEIVQPRVAWQTTDAVLLEYVERQYREGRTSLRRSSGLFTGETAAPRGVVWRHLQETWMPPGKDSIQMRTATAPRREA